MVMSNQRFLKAEHMPLGSLCRFESQDPENKYPVWTPKYQIKLIIVSAGKIDAPKDTELPPNQPAVKYVGENIEDLAELIKQQVIHLLEVLNDLEPKKKVD